MLNSLKSISEECFLFNVNDNVSLKFLLTLGGLLEGTHALGDSKDTWALGHSQGTRRALGRLGHSGIRALRALRHLGTQTLGHSRQFIQQNLSENRKSFIHLDTLIVPQTLRQNSRRYFNYHRKMFFPVHSNFPVGRWGKLGAFTYKE